MKRFLAFLLFCCALPLFAQNARTDGIVFSRSGLPAPGALVAVCTQPANTTAAPCTPKANLCSSATDNVCTSPNPVTADGLGNYSFYVRPGTYTLQFYGSGLTTRVQTDQAIGLATTASTGTVTIDTVNSRGLGGLDVGAWINSAIALLPAAGGQITMACGTYNGFVTQVNTQGGKNIRLVGCARGGTILNWSGTGAAFKVGGSSGGYQDFVLFSVVGQNVSAAGQYGFYVNNANNTLNLLLLEITQMGDVGVYIDGATANVSIAYNSIHANHFNFAAEVNSSSAENVVFNSNSMTGNDGGIEILAALAGVVMEYNDVESGATFASSRPMLYIPFGSTGHSSLHNTWGYGVLTTGAEVVLIGGNASLSSRSDKFSIGKTGQIALHVLNTAQANHFDDDSFAGINTNVGIGWQVDAGALDNWFGNPQYFNALANNYVDNGTRTNCSPSNLLLCSKLNLLGPATFSGQIAAPSAFFSGTGAGAIFLAQGPPVTTPPYAGWQIMCGTVCPGANLPLPSAQGPGVLEATGETGATGTAPCASCGSLTTITIGAGGFYSVAPACSITGGGGSGGACTATGSFPGPVTGGTITNGGSGYTSVATVTFNDQSVTHFGIANYRYTHLENSATLDGRLNACKTALASSGGTCDMTREPSGQSFSATVNFTQSSITIILPANTITFPNNVTINKSGNNSSIICKVPGACILDASNNGSVGAVNVTAGSKGLLKDFEYRGGRLNSQTGFEINVSGSYQVVDNVSGSDAGAFGTQLVNCYECKAINTLHVDRSTKAGIGVNTSLLATTDPTTQSGTTATLTASAANQILGPTGTISPIYVANCLNAIYNGDFTGTVTGAKTITYTMASAPGANTTGCSYTIRSIGVIIGWNNFNDCNTTDTGDGCVAIQSSGGVGLTDGTQVFGNVTRYKVFGTTICSNPTNVAPSIVDTGCSEAFQQTDKPVNTEMAGNRAYNCYRECFASSGTGIRMHDNVCVNPALVTIGTGNGCYMISVSNNGGLQIVGDAVFANNYGLNNGTNTSAYCLSVQAGSGSASTTFRDISIHDNNCVGGTATFGIGIRFSNAAGSLVLSAAANASAGTTVYTGTITNGGSNGRVGETFVVAGFVTGANNGTFVCTASTTTTLTLNNAAGAAESHAATAAMEMFISNVNAHDNAFTNTTTNLSLTYTTTVGAFTTNNNGTMIQGSPATLALATALINNNTCTSAQTVSSTGVDTSTFIGWEFSVTPVGVTGYDPTAAHLDIYSFPTANTMNVIVCNRTGGGITPAAMSLLLSASHK